MAMLAAPTTRASSGAQPASSPLFAPAVVDSAPATVACTAAIAPVRLTDGLPFTRHVVHGGESILLQAGGLPANAAIRVLLDLPRVRRSGSLEVPISYSPPTLAAGSDAAGTLVDAHGKKAVTVTLPADTATGTATISLVLQPGAGPAPALQAVRTWHVPVAPSAPAILVHTRPLTAVTYRVSDPAAPGTLCTGNANASGALLLTGVPAGTGYLAIGTASSPIVAYHPVTAPGEITQVQSSGPAVGAGVAQAAAGGACDQQTGTVTQLQDTLSGVATAKSGSGPFGDYLAGVSALDTFTAELTSIGAAGAYEPISHATPVQVVLIHPGQPAIGVGSVAIGADTAGAGTQATPGYTSATLKFDTSALEVGANVLEWQVGSGANACKVDFVLNAAKNPANTVLGTLDTYYDPAVGYQISGVLPTKPRLYFRKDIDLQLPAESLASAQLPAEVFQNWINEGDIGIDVHETIRTDGSWTGTVSGHARLIILNHTLYNDTLPTYSGGGASLTQGSMVVKAEHLAHESRNVSLYNALFLIPDINTVAVVNVHLTIGGDVTASIGIPASLDSVVFTLLPTLTFSIGGTGDVFTPLGNVSAGISGTLGLAAPITLHVPGGLGVTFGANVSVSAHFNSDVFGHADRGGAKPPGAPDRSAQTWRTGAGVPAARSSWPDPSSWVPVPSVIGTHTGRSGFGAQHPETGCAGIHTGGACAVRYCTLCFAVARRGARRRVGRRSTRWKAATARTDWKPRRTDPAYHRTRAVTTADCLDRRAHRRRRLVLASRYHRRSSQSTPALCSVERPGLDGAGAGCNRQCRAH